MKFNAFILIALVLALSAFAEGISKKEIKDGAEPLHTNTFLGGGLGGIVGYGGGGSASGGSSSSSGGGGGGGGGSGAGSYSAGVNHGGVYGGGNICKWGCCSESHGYNHGSGAYYSCKCCLTLSEAKTYRESQLKYADKKN